MPDFNFEKAQSAEWKQDESHANLGHSSLVTERENLVAAIALRIRQSLDLELILQQTVAEVRQFLRADRVLIYRFEPDLSGVIVVESLTESTQSVFGYKLHDPCFAEQHLERYQQGKVHVVDDVEQANLATCYHDVLKKFGVKANLVVPIVANDQLWGLLITHHCRSPRPWQASEAELMRQLATQVGIAVQQAELYDRVQSLNVFLEQKINQRTAKLERAIKFATLTHKVTKKMRDSLDELQILQTVTQEIGEVLKIDRCKIELYNSDRTVAEVAYEYTNASPNCQGRTRIVADFPELDVQLLQKQSLQFVEFVPELNPEFNLQPNPQADSRLDPYLDPHNEAQATRLVCPICDDQGIFGNLWLLRPKEAYFAADEIILVEQVANQCAIAIRQARLFQNSQIQVQELARLNQLKDDFLKTVSHELRAPMSSIQLASETLEIIIKKEMGNQRSATFSKVLNIFHAACDRQNQLVDDLLTLCYIDAKKELMTMEWINLAVCLPQIIEPFTRRIKQQQQTLTIDLADSLPLFKSDLSSIKRILTELINNACKYTPPGEAIGITAAAIDQQIELKIHNTGVEIPSDEQQRIFDKFYRIPNLDPWQYGGTGIGLALVKNLVELLGGSIYLTSEPQKTIFTLDFPRELD